MIFIAKDYEGSTISIVNAKSKEIALAFWAGKDIYPTNILSIDNFADFADINKNPCGVYELINITKWNGSELKNFIDRSAERWDKNFYLTNK